MHDAPNIDTVSRTELLRRWLLEWDTFRALEPETADTVPPTAPPLEQTVSDEEPAPGDIWLLPPSLSPDLPRYVLVDAITDHGTASLVPFSIFCLPATPGELALSRAQPLAVLCPWNGCALPAAAVRRGWCIDELMPPERAALASVQSALAGHTQLAPPMTRRIGPPVRHPLDPRHAYIDREREFAETLTRRAGHGTLRYPQHEPRNLSMAAEGHDPYGTPGLGLDFETDIDPTLSS